MVNSIVNQIVELGDEYPILGILLGKWFIGEIDFNEMNEIYTDYYILSAEDWYEKYKEQLFSE